MSLWRRFLSRRRIGTRLVAAITLAMMVVLLLAGAFVFWRVAAALNGQLDQDLVSLAEISEHTVQKGNVLPADTPGQTVQVFAIDGTLLRRSDDDIPPLVSKTVIRRAAEGYDEDINRGGVLHPTPLAYRITAFPVTSPTGRVIVMVAINRHHHDEALRELLFQLVLTDLAAIVAAGFVGYGATRAALGPVEEYRRAALRAGSDPSHRLPVDDRDDELTRLGHTFNSLLDEIAEGHDRERQFLADASHELRSPLALLSAEIEWARHRTRSPEQLDEVFSSLGSEVSRLVELSNALLDLEELRGGDPDQLEAVPADELVEAALAGHREAAAAAGRRLRVTATPEPASVDRRWVEVAISNLVGNAIKHGAGQITVDAAVTDGRLRVAVRDEGSGVPDSLGERAFDRFSRADESRTTRGNGLGLALVRAVADAHGGTAGLVDGGVYLEIPTRTG